jgi:hypothetical protein
MAAPIGRSAGFTRFRPASMPTPKRCSRTPGDHSPEDSKTPPRATVGRLFALGACPIRTQRPLRLLGRARNGCLPVMGKTPPSPIRRSGLLGVSAPILFSELRISIATPRVGVQLSRLRGNVTELSARVSPVTTSTIAGSRLRRFRERPARRPFQDSAPRGLCSRPGGFVWMFAATLAAPYGWSWSLKSTL